jgi:hypothetical protein
MVSSIAEQVGAYRWSIFNKMTALTVTITLQSGAGTSVFLPQQLNVHEFNNLLTPQIELLKNAGS